MEEERLYGLSSIVHRLYFRNRRHERQFADTDEKRTLIDTDASQHRFTQMIFQIFIRVNPCSLLRAFVPLCLRGFLPRYVSSYHWLLYFRNRNS